MWIGPSFSHIELTEHIIMPNQGIHYVFRLSVCQTLIACQFVKDNMPTGVFDEITV